MKTEKLRIAEILIEKEYEYDKWRKEIPFIELPEGYLFKPIPNFCGSVIRFLAQKKGRNDSVSVYLDCYDRLGIMDKPYWEVYPVDGDTFRCGINEVDELSAAIVEALNEKDEE